MRKSSMVLAVLALAASAVLAAQATLPQMQSVDPASAKAGDIVTVTGENLDQSIVAALYLTNGKEDFKAEITQQTSTSITFKIPSIVKTGRLALMVLTKGKEPKLIEEPVKVLIEAPMAPTTGY